LGLPGAGAAKALEAEDLRGVQTLYVLREPDGGGTNLVHKIIERLSDLGWEGDLFEVRLESVKDASDLHRLDPDGFKVKFFKALNIAQRLEIAPAGLGGSHAAQELDEDLHLSSAFSHLHHFAKQLVASGIPAATVLKALTRMASKLGVRVTQERLQAFIRRAAAERCGGHG
jgi:hypothetical protein